jgi:hypothetical protein
LASVCQHKSSRERREPAAAEEEGMMAGQMVANDPLLPWQWLHRQFKTENDIHKGFV